MTEIYTYSSLWKRRYLVASIVTALILVSGWIFFLGFDRTLSDLLSIAYIWMIFVLGYVYSYYSERVLVNGVEINNEKIKATLINGDIVNFKTSNIQSIGMNKKIIINGFGVAELKIVLEHDVKLSIPTNISKFNTLHQLLTKRIVR
ncbi:MAG: hypothetical protein HRU04_22265 [Oceanospirillaceae bacterium]|nr:hypothetical protein [Oceanospirillaceae bacterium]